MRALQLVLAAACLAQGSAVAAEDPLAGADAYVPAAMKRWDVPGVAVAAVKDGRVVFARGYGVCAIGTDQPVTKDTVFSIASCTKSFTATALAMLVDEGRLEWDDPVVKHLPNFRLATDYLTKHVTIRDLLCHRTGLQRADLLGDRGDMPFDESFDRLRYLKPIAELRTELIYNNHMYNVAGKIVERVSGKPWAEFVDQRILHPLNMTSTATSIARVEKHRLARRHWRPEEEVIARPLFDDSAVSGAAGSLHSSVVDLAKWIQFQLAEGTYDGEQLLKAQTVREMQSIHMSRPVPYNVPRSIYAARFYGAGLGWFVLDYRGRKLVYHNGAWGAWVAMIPEERIGVAVLCNVDLNGLDGMLMYDFLDALLVGPEVAWDRAKWKLWLEIEGPEHSYRPRDQALATLEEKRDPHSPLETPLERFAGEYESKLYGRIVVEQRDGQLWVKCGRFTTELTHWQNTEFYARAPTRLTYDWLLQFDSPDETEAKRVVAVHVGWDAHEAPHEFLRVPSPQARK